VATFVPLSKNNINRVNFSSRGKFFESCFFSINTINPIENCKMSDAGRKNISTKINEAITPESEKSTLEKGKEQVTSTLDKAVGSNVPDNQKSFTQTVADNVQQGSDNAKADLKKQSEQAEGEAKTLAETAQEYVEVAKTEIGKAAEYVSGVVTGATEGAKTGADSTKK
ncbi:hypothetical protein MGO_04125, partial [Candida albicans P76055]